MKKIKYSRLFVLGIILYIIFQIIVSVLGKITQTAQINLEKLDVKINVKGMFIRDEHIVIADESGSITRVHEEDKKIKKTEDIAYIYKNEDITKLDLKVEELNKEINKLLEEIKSEENQLNKEIKRNQVKLKSEEKKILQEKINKNTTYLKADTSGIVSYKIDGNESIYTTDNLSEISKDDIENAKNDYIDLSKNNKIKNKEPVARMINDDSSYIAVCMGEKESNNFNEIKDVKLNILDQQMEADVYDIYKSGLDTIIILKITSQNTEIYDTRVEEFDIIYKRIEGLKIPKKAVETVDDKKGVYVVNNQTQDVNFVEIKGIQYENEEFIFIDYYKNNKEGIKTINIYDEILLNPNSINKNIKIK